MGKLLENYSKQLLGRMGVAVPASEVAATPLEAKEAVRRLGKPVVIKALVPVGKRGKAGAIKFASTPEEAAAKTEELLSLTVRNFPVKKVLVEERIDIDQEWYLSITYDKNKKRPVIIASTKGGVDVEELSRLYPKEIVIYDVDPINGLAGYQAREVWASLGVKGKLLVAAGTILSKIYKTFDHYDAYLLEINPIVIDKQCNLVAAASVMSCDDNAISRQSELTNMIELGSERVWRPLTELEKKMVEVNEADPYRGTARYTEFPGGEIGFMCGGGGGSLVCFDGLVDKGCQPANYTEVGGNPPEQKVFGLTKGILSKPGVKGLFVAHNITNNTQVDVLARGITRALKDMNINLATFPVVVREAGVNDAAARGIFVEAGVEYYGEDITLSEACARMVARMNEMPKGVN